MSKESFNSGPAFIGDAQLAVGINVTGQDAGKNVACGAAGQLDLGFILGPELFVFPEIRPVLRSIFRSNLVGIISEENGLLHDGIVVTIGIVQTFADFGGPGGRIDLGDDVAGDKIVPDDGVETENDVAGGGCAFVNQTLLDCTGAFFNDGQFEAVLSCTLTKPVRTSGRTGVCVDGQFNTGAFGVCAFSHCECAYRQQHDKSQYKRYKLFHGMEPPYEDVFSVL